MRIIEPHIHMVSRTTDDYDRLFQAGVVAVTEPAFWAGFDRGGSAAFAAYFDQLTKYEAKRASQYGIGYYTWICLNPKEAEDIALAREVLGIIPEYLGAGNVLGIGEIGLNRNTPNEIAILEEHLDVAQAHGQMILVHTPHLEDKLKGTKIICGILKNRPKIDPDRVIIDHCEEHTIRIAKDAGFWAGLTVYPVTKLTPQRAVDILETFGADRIWVNSAADWGPSDPLAVPKVAAEMKRRGHDEASIAKVVYHNPGKFLSQSKKFKHYEE